MREKDLHYLVQKVEFLTSLVNDYGAIQKVIPTIDLTTFSGKYHAFLNELCKSIIKTPIAIISVENYHMLGDGQKALKTEMKEKDRLWIETTVFGYRTFILRGSTFFKTRCFPRNKVLILSYDPESDTIEIADNKFAIVNIVD